MKQAHVSDLAMGIFANTNYRDTLVDFPHLMPDPSILTVISSPKYYANNELFKIFNTFKLEAKALEVSEQTLKIESIQQLIDRQDIDVIVIKNTINDRLLKEVSEQTLKIESIQQLIDRQDIDVIVIKNTINDRLLKERHKEFIHLIQYVERQETYRLSTILKFEVSIRVRH
ncbi:unnamed protein product [Oppiella nova]|uniref:Uncharacterized protein n=1 Tax=Oppiella nova TaxID=334625 RepID=A0A7R9M5D8_9ACAR|nr:unnamed protein product [Oppiella nova]CAG2171103.1 unnamed protein product [Oppiella nova]